MDHDQDSFSASRANPPLRGSRRVEDQYHPTYASPTFHSTRPRYTTSSSYPVGFTTRPHHHHTTLYPHGSSYTHSPRVDHSPCSTASVTPNPSRTPSPGPLYLDYSEDDESDGESDSQILLGPSIRRRRDEAPRWWQVTGLSGVSRRRRRKGVASWFRSTRRMVMRFVRLPFVPKTRLTILSTLALLSAFGASLTFLLIYILNPDKEPLPWRGYCTIPPSTTAPPPLMIPPTASFPFIPPHNFTPPSFPPENLDSLSPAGLFIGVMSMDTSFERRSFIRSSWAGHERSRNGAGVGDDGEGTSRTVVRFILGQPRKDWERRIQLEMETYKDVVILPIHENMNSGKSHTFFTWASENAWVPPLPIGGTWDTTPDLSYSNITGPPPALATHDPISVQRDHAIGQHRPWVRPDFVVKVDDDSFLMLAELEARLRVELHTKPPKQEILWENETMSFVARAVEDTPVEQSVRTLTISPQHANGPRTLTISPNTRISRPPAEPQPGDSDPLIYWGYLVKNRFMAGELYALSWSLVNWVATDPQVKTMTRGAEDKQTSKWMRVHPRADEIRWASERCWIYDHPRAGTVYSHGFLFPSEVRRVQREILFDLKNFWAQTRAGTLPDAQSSAIAPASPFGPYGTSPTSWSRSTVSSWGARYSLPAPTAELTTAQSVEALVEGSELSRYIRGVFPGAIEPSWRYREGRRKRYENKRVGGTIIVHYIKKKMWFLETAMAFLEGDDITEQERIQMERDRAEDLARTSRMDSVKILKAVPLHNVPHVQVPIPVRPNPPHPPEEEEEEETERTE
ncbi:hypothetical protein BXZ70DRAFT_892960 [Cristinia sonorae]|uniref:Glycosyltransferase family 31 protein n=1 Tax=Cristinia sonorae TaxID=1940300 RepID=A0A8K0XQ05_9AGAR|nr:hypothetical protein BXZ70DRAFT_892960 [Cristinia sonorae]